MREWEYRPRHGGGAGYFGSEGDCLHAMEAASCGDVYGPTSEHETLRCVSCAEDNSTPPPAPCEGPGGPCDRHPACAGCVLCPPMGGRHESLFADPAAEAPWGWVHKAPDGRATR